MILLEEMCRAENDKIWKDTKTLVSDLSRRSLDELLKLEEGVISRSARNEFASNCVQ